MVQSKYGLVRVQQRDLGALEDFSARFKEVFNRYFPWVALGFSVLAGLMLVRRLK